MPAASPAAVVVFEITVAAVALIFLYGARLARGRFGSPQPMLVMSVLAGTIAVPGALAWAGWIDRYSPLPAPSLLLVLAATIGTVMLAFSSFGARLVHEVPVAGLVGYQVFRVPVEWVLHRLYLDGVVPVQMTYSGRNFDVLTGLSAFFLAVLLLSGRRLRGTVLLWNLAGLGLLGNIVTIAVLSTPVPFRAFLDGPPNLLPSTFPFVWLPTFLVQAALFGHLVVFRALRAESRGISFR